MQLISQIPFGLAIALFVGAVSSFVYGGYSSIPKVRQRMFRGGVVFMLLAALLVAAEFSLKSSAGIPMMGLVHL